MLTPILAPWRTSKERKNIWSEHSVSTLMNVCWQGKSFFFFKNFINAMHVKLTAVAKLTLAEMNAVVGWGIQSVNACYRWIQLVDHRIIESPNLEKTSKITSLTIHLLPIFPHWTMSLGTTSRHMCVLHTSRDGDSTTSLGSPFQCLITLLEKKFFLISNWNLPWCNLRPFPLVLLLVMWEKRPSPTSQQLCFRSL